MSMYNRYIRTPQGNYSRIPQEEQYNGGNRYDPHTTAGKEKKPPAGGFLDRLLAYLQLDHIDRGDILLLLLLLFLFQEDQDEELLIALGLLLIL